MLTKGVLSSFPVLVQRDELMGKGGPNCNRFLEGTGLIVLEH